MGTGEISLFRRGPGGPVLFLHAAGGAGEWSPFHGRLSRHFDLVAPDHPGFGLSDELHEVATMADLTAHYVALLDKLGIDRLDVVGASFGGWVAAELVSTIPDRVDHLVLMAPAGLDVPEAPPANLFEMAPPDLVRALFYDDATSGRRCSRPAPQNRSRRPRRTRRHLAAFARDPYLHNPDLPARLPRITCPALVIAAEVDVIIPARTARLTRGRSPVRCYATCHAPPMGCTTNVRMTWPTRSSAGSPSRTPLRLFDESRGHGGVSRLPPVPVPPRARSSTGREEALIISYQVA